VDEPGKVRTLLVELFALANLGALAGDVLLAHRVTEFHSGWTLAPIWFAGIATALYAVALLTYWQGGRRSQPWRLIGHLVGWGAIVVGVTGFILHLDSAFFEQQALRNLVYTAPFAAPLAFTGIGLLIVMNRMVDPMSPEWAGWVIVLALGGFAGNFVLALADHAQNGFFNGYEWLPVIAAALAVGFLTVPVVMRTSALYLWVCMLLMAGQVLIGLWGFVLHFASVTRGASDLSAVWESIKYAAPPFAPLLFVNLALLGLIGLGAAARDGAGVQTPSAARPNPAPS
jgi:hypothetical protein